MHTIVARLVGFAGIASTALLTWEAGVDDRTCTRQVVHMSGTAKAGTEPGTIRVGTAELRSNLAKYLKLAQSG